METNIKIEPAGAKIDVTGEIEEREGEAVELAFTIDYEDSPSFWRMLRRAEQENQRRQERLLKKLLRQNGRSLRPRKPAPRSRTALIARQKKARP